MDAVQHRKGILDSIFSFFTPSTWFGASSTAPSTEISSVQHTTTAQFPPKRAKLFEIARPQRKQQPSPHESSTSFHRSKEAVASSSVRSLENRDTTTENSKQKQPRVSSAPWKIRADGCRIKKRAILLGFNGAGYYGMQRNHGYMTIEEDLLTAFYEAGLIPKEGYVKPQYIRFQRCARTDKSVSAARQVVSLEMFPDDNAVEKINAKLPPSIRIFAIIPSTKGFNSKQAVQLRKFASTLRCSARRYEYLLPTYALCPKEMPPRETYRVNSEQLSKFQQVLDTFVGTHRFHNYTSGKKMNDPSCKRHILYFKALPNVQNIILKGMAVAVTRGFADMQDVYNTMNKPAVDVPRIPGLGLYLDCVCLHVLDLQSYHCRNAKTDLLTWESWDEEIETFKEKNIISEILRQEKHEQIIKMWLSNLYHHSYEARCREETNTEDTSVELPNSS
eukprot:gene9309-1576_t